MRTNVKAGLGEAARIVCQPVFERLAELVTIGVGLAVGFTFGSWAWLGLLPATLAAAYLVWEPFRWRRRYRKGVAERDRQRAIAAAEQQVLELEDAAANSRGTDAEARRTAAAGRLVALLDAGGDAR
jgi:hypothetical protein